MFAHVKPQNRIILFNTDREEKQESVMFEMNTHGAPDTNSGRGQTLTCPGDGGGEKGLNMDRKLAGSLVKSN